MFFWLKGVTEATLRLANVPTNVDTWNSGHIKQFVDFQFQGLWEAGFPKIIVKSLSHSDYTGQAPLGEYVKIRKQTPKQGFSLTPFTVTEGEFSMELSKNFLTNTPTYQTAGTIAHEMLHSLGHDHKNGYYDNNFITAFGDTLGNDGKYFKRSQGTGLLLNGETWRLPK